MCAYVCRGSESRHGSLIEWHSNPSHSTASGLCRERQQVQDGLAAALRGRSPHNHHPGAHYQPHSTHGPRASTCLVRVSVVPLPQLVFAVADRTWPRVCGPWSVPGPLRRTSYCPFNDRFPSVRHGPGGALGGLRARAPCIARLWLIMAMAGAGWGVDPNRRHLQGGMSGVSLSSPCVQCRAAPCLR